MYIYIYNILLLIFISSGSSKISICDVLDSPKRYEHKELLLRGRVISSTSVLGLQYYVLEKKGCQIRVVAIGGIVPKINAKLTVSGKLIEGYKFGDNRGLFFVQDDSSVIKD